MYNRYDIYMKQGVRDEAAYIKTGLEEDGRDFLTDKIGDATSSRITLLGKDGDVLFDSIENPSEMENHSNRPEFIEAEKKGFGEMVRYSDTLSKQTFYYAIKLKDDQVLRVARTTDSLLMTMLSSFLLLGGLVCVIFVIEFFLVQNQTQKLIEPINQINLEKPLDNVCYEELRPLLFRLDQQNRQIKKQMEDLKNAESARKEFTANVSHELKTPLTSIKGFAELLETDSISSSDTKNFASIINKESSRLMNLVQDTLLLTKQNHRIDKKKINLTTLIQNILQSSGPQINEKSLHLESQIEEITFKTNEPMVHSIFENLIENAIKYTPANGQIFVSLHLEQNKVIFSVTDNGPGLSEIQKERIFDRFYRVDESRAEVSGTGLGLAIVEKNVQELHGTIDVVSILGKGTTFTVNL